MDFDVMEKWLYSLRDTTEANNLNNSGTDANGNRGMSGRGSEGIDGDVHDNSLNRKWKPRIKISRHAKAWTPREADMRDALKDSNNSSPEPESIPLGALRAN